MYIFSTGAPGQSGSGNNNKKKTCNDIGGNVKSNTVKSINDIIGRNNCNGSNRDDDGSITSGGSCSGILFLILIVDIISPSVSS